MRSSVSPQHSPGNPFDPWGEAKATAYHQYFATAFKPMTSYQQQQKQQRQQIMSFDSVESLVSGEMSPEMMMMMSTAAGLRDNDDTKSDDIRGAMIMSKPSSKSKSSEPFTSSSTSTSSRNNFARFPTSQPRLPAARRLLSSSGRQSGNSLETEEEEDDYLADYLIDLRDESDDHDHDHDQAAVDKDKTADKNTRNDSFDNDPYEYDPLDANNNNTGAASSIAALDQRLSAFNPKKPFLPTASKQPIFGGPTNFIKFSGVSSSSSCSSNSSKETLDQVTVTRCTTWSPYQQQQQQQPYQFPTVPTASPPVLSTESAAFNFSNKKSDKKKKTTKHTVACYNLNQASTSFLDSSRGLQNSKLSSIGSPSMENGSGKLKSGSDSKNSRRRSFWATSKLHFKRKVLNLGASTPQAPTFRRKSSLVLSGNSSSSSIRRRSRRRNSIKSLQKQQQKCKVSGTGPGKVVDVVGPTWLSSSTPSATSSSGAWKLRY